MPDYVVKSLWELIPTAIYFVVGLVMFGISLLVMEKVTPFSIREEITEKQNVALAIVVGATVVGLAILLSALLR